MLHAAGLQHEGSHRRHPLAELAGDQAQGLTSPPPRPHLVLLRRRQSPGPHPPPPPPTSPVSAEVMQPPIETSDVSATGAVASRCESQRYLAQFSQRYLAG